MHAAVEPPDPATTAASAHGTIALSVLLERLAGELDGVAALIVHIEGALGEVVVQVGSLSPVVLSRLQQIDLALQGIRDVSRVITHAAGDAQGPVLDKTEIGNLIRMQDIARRILMPDAPPASGIKEDVCWF